MPFLSETGHYVTTTTSETGLYPAASDTLTEIGERLFTFTPGAPPEGPTPIPRIGPDRRAGN